MKRSDFFWLIGGLIGLAITVPHAIIANINEDKPKRLIFDNNKKIGIGSLHHHDILHICGNSLN